MKLQPLIIEKLKMLEKLLPEYSFGELLYTILRKKNLKNKGEKFDTTWLRSISDKEFYTSIEKAIENEPEEN